MNDEKDYILIGELSKELDISEHTVRKYESDFNLKIPRNDLGHRYYTNQELELFKRILDWKKKGFNKTNINKMLNRSVDAIEQKEQAMELVSLDKLTGKEVADLMAKKMTDMFAKRERELKEEFEKQLDEKLAKQKEEIVNQVREQIEVENDKLTKYIAATREEEEKGSFFSKLFNRKKK